MIFVDVYVPAVDKTYNFSLNEDVPVSAIIDEIVEMIEQKERMVYAGDISAMHLYHRQGHRVLSRANSLMDLAVTNGTNLILI